MEMKQEDAVRGGEEAVDDEEPSRRGRWLGREVLDAVDVLLDQLQELLVGALREVGVSSRSARMYSRRSA